MVQRGHLLGRVVNSFTESLLFPRCCRADLLFKVEELAHMTPPLVLKVDLVYGLITLDILFVYRNAVGLDVCAGTCLQHHV